MIAVLVSVVLSALVTVALLGVTRQRLARQFEDIQRRLGQLERTVAELKLDRDRSTVSAQLRRLHLGMVRIQEGFARRFGPLLRTSGPLAEYEMIGLEHWTKALGGTVSQEEIARLAEVFVPEKAADRMDVLASVLALFRWRNERVDVVIDGDGAGQAIASLAPDYFREVALRPAASSADAKAIFVEAGSLPESSVLNALAPGARLIICGLAADEATAIAGFWLLGAEWNTAIYERAPDVPA